MACEFARQTKGGSSHEQPGWYCNHRRNNESFVYGDVLDPGRYCNDCYRCSAFCRLVQSKHSYVGAGLLTVPPSITSFFFNQRRDSETRRDGRGRSPCGGGPFSSPPQRVARDKAKQEEPARPTTGHSRPRALRQVYLAANGRASMRQWDKLTLRHGLPDRQYSFTGYPCSPERPPNAQPVM